MNDKTKHPERTYQHGAPFLFAYIPKGKRKQRQPTKRERTSRGQEDKQRKQEQRGKKKGKHKSKRTRKRTKERTRKRTKAIK